MVDEERVVLLERWGKPGYLVLRADEIDRVDIDSILEEQNHNEVPILGTKIKWIRAGFKDYRVLYDTKLNTISFLAFNECRRKRDRNLLTGYSILTLSAGSVITRITDMLEIKLLSQVDETDDSTSLTVSDFKYLDPDTGEAFDDYNPVELAKEQELFQLYKDSKTALTKKQFARFITVDEATREFYDGIELKVLLNT